MWVWFDDGYLHSLSDSLLEQILGHLDLFWRTGNGYDSVVRTG